MPVHVSIIIDTYSAFLVLVTKYYLVNKRTSASKVVHFDIWIAFYSPLLIFDRQSHLILGATMAMHLIKTAQIFNSVSRNVIKVINSC